MNRRLVLRTIYGKTYAYEGFTDGELEQIIERHLNYPPLKSELKEWKIIDG